MPIGLLSVVLNPVAEVIFLVFKESSGNGVGLDRESRSQPKQILVNILNIPRGRFMRIAHKGRQ